MHSKEIIQKVINLLIDLYLADIADHIELLANNNCLTDEQKVGYMRELVDELRKGLTNSKLI